MLCKRDVRFVDWVKDEVTWKRPPHLSSEAADFFRVMGEVLSGIEEGKISFASATETLNSLVVSNEVSLPSSATVGYGGGGG